MAGFLEEAFSLVCGRNPDHTWAWEGTLLPMCQRCTGLYAGAAVGFVLHFILRPRAASCFLWIHGLFLVMMVPFGFHMVPQGPFLRMLSGQLFGYGIIAFFWLPVGARIKVHKKTPDSRQAGLYTLGAGLSLLILQASAYGGGPDVHLALSWMAPAGLAVVALLSLADLCIMVTYVAARIVRTACVSTHE